MLAMCCCAEDLNQEQMITIKQDLVMPEEAPVIAHPVISGKTAPAAPEDPPQGSADEPNHFTVTVDRAPGTFLGIDLVAAGKVCMVDNITENDSLVGEWNRTCDSSAQVRRYDRLCKVDGRLSEKGKDALDAIKACQGKVTIEFERPNILEVRLPTGKGQSLGLRLKAGPNFLLVTNVDEGSVKVYNSGVDQSQQIKASSRIMTVNGKTVSGEELMKEIQRSADALEVVELKVLTWS
eukprot:TRINITY_DN74725_c0_g1_i1.p1 TRINITY_DN74725_c0_g1~~TRINITY_DN74725_c0_g1_i1.p1  ORF type:complete len:237 (+),score=51.59 TRINITY_DN74725_c0_g1_i1:28-738(+)